MGRTHIEALKAAADPGRVADALGLKSRGKRFFCPVCQPNGGKTPDLSIGDKGFHCFKCDIKGDLLKLVEVAGRMDFKDAVAFLERETGLSPRGGYQGKGRGEIVAPGGVQMPFMRTKMAFRQKSEVQVDPAIYEAFLAGCRPLEGAALEWLTRDRGIKADVVEACRLRFCGREYLDLVNDLKTRFGAGPLLAAGILKTSKKGRPVPSFWHYYASKAGFLVIPYLLDERPVYLKARPPVSKDKAEGHGLCRFLNTAAAIPCLYNVDALKGNPDRVFICEGESDTWTALTHGVAAVGSPGARQFKAAWVEGFRGLVDAAGRSTVFLVMDADPAGVKGAGLVADLFLNAGLPLPRRIKIPEGKDLSEYMEGMTE